ncbi:MAG TPA: efflux RND transporter permease subunit, partial [Pirellulaceae bacterium]|nr:efflux RND transporter permease subunit [Pirellulaceae bacterium]
DMLRMSVVALLASTPDRALVRRPTDSEIGAIASSLSASLVPHHGAAPGVLELEELLNDAAMQLDERGHVDSVDAVLNPPPTWMSLAESWSSDLLAVSRPTLAERVRRRVDAEVRKRWERHLRSLDAELIDRAAATFVRLLLEDLLRRAPATDPELLDTLERMQAQRENPPQVKRLAASHHAAVAAPLDITPLPAVDQLQVELTKQVAARLILWKVSREDLGMFGGEMDRALQMPGWTNVWTRPIQNRVDMLNTGVGSTAIAIRVLGRNLDDVVTAGDTVAAAVKDLPGAVNVIADPVRGKSFLEVHVDRRRAADLGVDVFEVQQAVQAATGGTVAGQMYEGRARHAIRVRFERRWREDEATLKKLPIPVRRRSSQGEAQSVDAPEFVAPEFVTPEFVTLEQVATVETREGPAAIKGENGLLRTYVRLDVRDRDASDFVKQARSVVARRVTLPPGVYLEWTGGFEYWERSRETLSIVVPVAVMLTLLLLYWTYRDMADALLVLLAVPGAVAGGMLLQWLWGCKFSMTVAIGYLSCFGMATATGVIMLVYLREAVDVAGGLEKITLDELRSAVLRGAVHRLRPKLLAEATTLIGLAPMLWATGVGAEVIGPMAVPVLGGILVADEVIDLFLPVMFYWVRRRRWQRLHSPVDGDR